MPDAEGKVEWSSVVDKVSQKASLVVDGIGILIGDFREQLIRAQRADDLGLVKCLEADDPRDARLMATALVHMPQQRQPSQTVVPGLLDGLWKLALVGGLLTASLQLGAGITPLAGQLQLAETSQLAVEPTELSEPTGLSGLAELAEPSDLTSFDAPDDASAALAVVSHDRQPDGASGALQQALGLGAQARAVATRAKTMEAYAPAVEAQEGQQEIEAQAQGAEVEVQEGQQEMEAQAQGAQVEARKGQVEAREGQAETRQGQPEVAS